MINNVIITLHCHTPYFCYYLNMINNIGNKDRILRIILGVALLFLGILYQSGISILFGAFSIFEGVTSWCALYQILGINTCPVPKRNKLQVKKYFVLFTQGIFIFTIALLLNIFAKAVNWSTWYDFLQTPKEILSFDNYIFLFILYPLSFGISSMAALKLTSSKGKQV